jgi:hypothetical protein
LGTENCTRWLWHFFNASFRVHSRKKKGPCSCICITRSPEILIFKK